MNRRLYRYTKKTEDAHVKIAGELVWQVLYQKFSALSSIDYLVLGKGACMRITLVSLSELY